MNHDKPDVTVMTLRIERDKLEAFRGVAVSHQRTVSQEIRWMIDRAVAEFAQRERDEAAA